MSGHTSEEKIKILYEDSLREIRTLARRMETMSSELKSSAELISRGKSVIREENEKILVKAVDDIKVSVAQVILTRDKLGEAATTTARSILTGDDGPIRQLDSLVKKQHDALGWINRAAKFYEVAYVTKPMAAAFFIGGLVGGSAGGLIGQIILKLYFAG